MQTATHAMKISPPYLDVPLVWVQTLVVVVTLHSTVSKINKPRSDECYVCLSQTRPSCGRTLMPSLLLSSLLQTGRCWPSLLAILLFRTLFRLNKCVLYMVHLLLLGSRFHAHMRFFLSFPLFLVVVNLNRCARVVVAAVH